MFLIRYYLATFLLNIVIKIGLPVDRNYAYTLLDNFENIPLELDKGRTWGVVVAPWSITDEGLELAKEQRDQAIKAAIEFRKKVESKK